MPPSSDSPRWPASANLPAYPATSQVSPASPTSVNSDTLRGSSSDTSSLQAVSQPVPECFHLAMEGEDVPAMLAPCHEHPGMNRRAVFGMKLSVGRAQKTGNDPFNYENKYPEDEPYKEMAEDSRFWKTCVDEVAKVDAGKVADWTDALDVLLVFAGLFSGVVSTFVCQTFQNLQVDPTELVFIVLDELLSIQRAIDEHGPGSSKHVPHSDTSFPEQAFGLIRSGSLTTALIAVVTKQWIHQYMDSTQLGTPRARARVRQFRCIQLEAWHVPAIIGLLPVLMHVAMGVFFSGLIIHIRSLNTTAAAVVGLIVFFALLAYVGTNLFPVYDPSCPYKTPLSAYTYTAFRRIRGFFTSTLPASVISFVSSITSFLKRLTSENAVSVDDLLAPLGITSTSYQDFDPLFSEEVTPPAHWLIPSSLDISIILPMTLRAAEQQVVDRTCDYLDAHSAAWLYNVSSNTSVRNIVLQAASNLPLHVIPVLKDHIGARSLEEALSKAVASPQYREPDRQAAFERLARSLFRFFPQTQMTLRTIHSSCRYDSSLAILLDITNSKGAADFVGRQILAPSKYYDAAVWAQILANAFFSSPDWLPPSSGDFIIWETLVSWLCFEPHTCLSCIRPEGSKGVLYSVHSYKGVYINVIDNIDKTLSADDPMSLLQAMIHFMRLSVCEMMLRNMDPSLVNGTGHVPSDVRLRLALIQTEWMQRTSHPADTGNWSAVAWLIKAISCSVGVGATDDVHVKHEDAVGATFFALRNVITSTFTTEILSRRNQQQLLRPFFRCLTVDTSLIKEYQHWITGSPLLAHNLVDLVFTGPIQLPEALPLLADIIEFAVVSQCPILLPMVCSQLCRIEWLETMGPIFLDQTYNCALWDNRAYSFLAASFARSMGILKSTGDPTYQEVSRYIQRGSNLPILCQILLLSDVETRAHLWRLVPLIDPTLWPACLDALDAFIAHDLSFGIYRKLLQGTVYPYPDGRPLEYNTMAELSLVVSRFANHVRTHRFDCECYKELYSSSLESPIRHIWQRIKLGGERD